MVDVNTYATLDALFPHLVTLRRHFHQNPELAYEEVGTAQKIIEELGHLGIPYDYPGKGGGVVGRLEGSRPGRTIALRAEMDALPCQERTGLPFASRVPDQMHACGPRRPYDDAARRGHPAKGSTAGRHRVVRLSASRRKRERSLCGPAVQHA